MVDALLSHSAQHITRELEGAVVVLALGLLETEVTTRERNDWVAGWSGESDMTVVLVAKDVEVVWLLELVAEGVGRRGLIG